MKVSLKTEAGGQLMGGP